MDKILGVQRKMQQKYSHMGKGEDPSEFSGREVGTVLNYIQQQHYFLQEEVSELMEEIGGGRQALKPWSNSYDSRRDQAYAPDYKTRSEAIDMLCFCLNICLAAGLTPDNLDEEFAKVINKNVDRIENGY